MFGMEPVKRRKGGSQNPIVFHDYESFVAKFQDKEKTTDDCYTPPIFLRPWLIMWTPFIRWMEKKYSARFIPVVTMNMRIIQKTAL